MKLRLVLGLGNPKDASSFEFYTRLGSHEEPTYFGESLLCPITEDLVLPVAVVGFRVGGEPLLVLWTDEQTGALAHSLISQERNWVPLSCASDIRGGVYGVFINGRDDVYSIDNWPLMPPSELHLLAATGLLEALPQLKVDGISGGDHVASILIPEPPLPFGDFDAPRHLADVVDLDQWRSRSKDEK